MASKSFLITIGDRSITGMIAREQMVGPWQVPVADAARSLNVGNYLILYRIEARTVEIVRIVHGARDLTTLF